MIASTKFTGETLAWFAEGDQYDELETPDIERQSTRHRAFMFFALAASLGFVALFIARGL